MTALTVHVPGIPVPQGSMKQLGPRKVVHSNPALMPWRSTVVGAVQAQMAAGGEWPLLGAVSLSLVFTLPRPKSVPKSRTWPAVRPDIDKLERAVSDALESAGAIANDGQICHVEKMKAYGVPGLVLTLRALGAEVAA